MSGKKITLGVVILAAVGAASVAGYNYVIFSSLRSQCIDKLTQETRELTIELEANQSDEQIEALANTIRNVDGVTNVRFESSSDALEKFAERYADNPLITKTRVLNRIRTPASSAV